MEKKEFRAVIKHSYIKGNTPKEIKPELNEVRRTSAASFETVYNWVNEFKRDRTSTYDEPRLGRQVEAATLEIIEKVHDMILNDRRVKVREIVEVIGISHVTVVTILHQEYCMTNLWGSLVPRLLTVENKRNHLTNSKALL